MVRLRTPRCDEAAILTELCIRSKAVWGYDEEFMHACRGELTLTASIMRSSSVKVAEIDGHLVGVTQVTVKGELAELNKLFVEPPCLRSGAGKALFEWAKTVARDAGAATMVIEADPDAAGFYRRMGAVEKGTAPSGSIPGRLLPRLELGLSPMPAERIFQVVVDWARTQPTIQAVAIVGSYARGQARPDSDLDLVFPATNPLDFRADIGWLRAIDWNALNVRPLKWEDEDYGALWSRRIWLGPNGVEVEIGFASVSWANVNPLDSGTRHVISDGCRILHDPKGMLRRLCSAVRQAEQR